LRILSIEIGSAAGNGEGGSNACESDFVAFNFTRLDGGIGIDNNDAGGRCLLQSKSSLDGVVGVDAVKNNAVDFNRDRRRLLQSKSSLDGVVGVGNNNNVVFNNDRRRLLRRSLGEYFWESVFFVPARNQTGYAPINVTYAVRGEQLVI
jgi:hypothetical protein